MAITNPFLETPTEDIVADLKPVAKAPAPAPVAAKPATTTTDPITPSHSGRGFAPTRDDIVKRATALDIDPKLALSFFSQESSGNWNSRDSNKGARGGMQVMPGTYKSMMGTSDGQDDPWNNMEAGLRYIRYGQNKLNTRDVRLLAAGYHAGYDHPSLAKGIVPNVSDGNKRTPDYANDIVARYEGRIPERSTPTGSSRRLIGGNKTAMPDMPPTAAADEPDWGSLKPAATEDGPDFSSLKPVDTWLAEAKAQQAAIDNKPMWDRATEAGQRGYQGMVQNLTTARWALAGGDAESLANDLAAKISESQKRDKTTGQKEMDAAFKNVTNAKGAVDTTIAGFKAIGTAIVNPKDTAIEIVENAPNTLPSLGLGLAGAGGGALAGAPGGAPGAVVGAIVGGRTGMAAGTTVTELGAEVEQMVSERLDAAKSPPTAQNILAILNDKDFQSEARTRGLKKGLTVAAVDQVFLGFGGKIATAPARKLATKELAEQGIDVSTRAARKQALASPAGRAAIEAVKPSAASRTAAATTAVVVDAAGETLGEGLSQKVARGEVDYGDALREGVVSMGQSVAQTGAGVAIEKGKQFVQNQRAADSTVQPTVNAPSDAQGPLQRATENAATKPERVTVKAPEGTVSGQVTGQAPDGTTEIVGDDGQVYTFKVGENGITMSPDAPNAPLSNALEVASDEHAAIAQAAPEQADSASVNALNTANSAETPSAPAMPAVPSAPVQADLTTMDDPALRERLKYIADQAKTNGGWNKMLTGERARIEKEINARQQAAPAVNLEQPAVNETPAVVNQEPPQITALPKDLAGAKPRYNYGNKSFELKFDSDIDRAAFIAAQDKPSKRDADYLNFAMQATGMSEAEVRAHGQAVRNAIKGQAKDASPGTLKVPTIPRGESAVSNQPIAEQPATGELPATAAVAPSAPAEPAATGRESGAANAGDAASAAVEPAKLAGADKKRATAIERIAKGTAFFGTPEKANEFISKNNLKDTHEVVQTGKVRFEVMEKQANGAKQTKTDIITEHRVTDADGRPATLQIRRDKADPSKVAEVKVKTDGERQPLTLGAQGVVTDEQLIKNLTDGDVINGNDNRTEGQRDGAEAVVEKADANETTAAAVQPDAEPQEAGQGQVTPEAESWRNNVIKARAYAKSLGINTKGMELDEITRAIDEKNGAQTVEPAVDGEAWWKSLTPTGRRQAMEAAGVNLPDRVYWPNIKPAMQEKLLAVMNGQNDELDAEMRSYEAKAEGKDFAERVTKTLAKVRRFASGLSSNGDFKRASRASGGLDLGGVGVDVGQISRNTIDAMANAIVNLKTAVFIDSGAFSAFRRGLKSGQFTPMDFDDILARYDAITDAIGKAAEEAGEVNDYPRPLLVMPDVVGDQAASIELIRKHADWIRAEAKSNLSQPIIPIQKGEMTMADAYAQVVSILGTDNFVVGIPSNEEAVTPSELEQFVRDARPKAIHILGAAADVRLRPRIESVVRAGVEGIQITADASPIRNQVIRSVAKGAKRGDVIEDLLLNQDDPALENDRKQAEATGTVTRAGGKPYADLDAAGRALKDKGLNRTHDAVEVEGGYVLKPKAEAISERLLEARNDLIDVNNRIEQQGRVVDDRLLERKRQHEKVIADLESEQNLVETPDAAAELMDRVVKAYGFTEQGEMPAGIAKTATKLRDALIQRDRGMLEQILHPSNPNSRKAFEALFAGQMKLPKTVAGTNEVIARFLGQVDAQVQAEVATAAAEGAPAAVEWKQSKPGDYLGADRYLVKRSIKTKREAEQLAAETGGSISLDPPNQWAVLADKPLQVSQAAPAAQFADNKIFTQDAVDRARARLKSKLSQLNSGIDPEMMIDGMTIAGAYIEAGVREFGAYAKAMTEDFGDRITPYLLSFYEGARNYPGIDTEGMTPQDEAKRQADALMAAPAEENENESAQLDEPGQGALEGTQTDLLSGVEPEGETQRGAEGSGGTDARGNERTGGGRVQQSGSVGDGAGDVSVPGRRTRAGRGGEQGRGAVQRGKRAAKPDPTIESGGNDLLTPTDGQRAQDRSSDFVITDEDAIGEGGAKTKFRNNMAAIRLLKQLMSENRQATRAEQAVLAKYVGWGGIPQAFYRDNNEVSKGWEKEAAELKEALTPEELAAAASSTRNAHYTSPEIVQAVWDAAKRFGFQGGRVLEPSVGVGNFFGLMPTALRGASQLTGVELDRITGGIAKYLYPQANIAAPVGFQDFSAPDNYFDLAIGNPPFGRESIYDGNRRKISGFSIHNYFFAKSIDTVKPNGVLAMVVTNRLLDSMGDKARQYIADRAEFLGAVRLPNDAFMANAGTQVTTDIIFLRKLAEGEQSKGERWMDVKQYTDKDGKQVPLNEYFVRNPDMMLGEFGAYGSMYSPDDPALVKRPGQDTPALLQAALNKLPQGFMDPPTAEPTRETITPSRDISGVKVGSVFEQDGQIFERREDMLNEQQAAPVTFASEKAKERVSGMIRVRDALTDVRAAQLSETATDKQIEAARAALNRAYDAFVKANGPINGDSNKRLMRDDPSWPQIAALEDGFDKGISPAVAKTTGETARPPSARKAAIFSKRTQSPYKAPEKANTAKDALVTSLAERGRVDLDYMASLYGKTPDMIAKELGDLIYKNPVSGWESREQYLSGNVKQKLAQAIEAAKTDPSMAANIEALRAVQPTDIEAVDIDVKVGAHWIPADVMQNFVGTITEGQNVKALYNPVTATWTLSAERVPNSAVTQWATERAPIVKVLEAAANQKTIQIFDEDRQAGTRTLNEAATTAANEKVERVKAEWKNWIWADDARRERLARIYNDTFNTDVARDFDGSHLTFPGKVGNDIVELRPHQANAIWRIVQSNTSLLDHVVGAGKTFTMIGGIMEMRRMGLAKKPVLVVPNHLVGQWAEDFMKLYPGANILAATKKDFEKNNRKKLFARIATGDWDAVILAHSSFGKAEVEPEFQEQFIKQQIADMDTSIVAMREAEGKSSRNVKQIEKQKAALEEKLKKLFDTGAKDDNLYFSELGIDAVFVDEAHEFKNLGFSTGMQRVAGLGNPTGSQKAADLFMKVQAVLKRTGGRNIVFATGTPISNTMAEMYTMQRYLDYATLKAQGIAHFDAWAKTFGEVVTDWELSPSGQYKMNSRFAKFVNMPELMQRYQSFADVVNRDDINRMLAVQGKKLPVPKVATGKPENIVVERSNDQAQYIGVPTVTESGGEVYPEGSLIHRSENLPKKAEKGADNMLKIMSDARKAALDMRLIDPSYPDNPASKVNVAAGNIKSIYDQTAKDKGTQIVFIDLSTPKGAAAKEAAALRELIAAAEEGDDAAQEKLDAMSPDELMALESGQFSVYDDLKAKLIARGIPENEIAFIHDANTEIQKQELFGKVKSGRVRVMLGSTAKMGAGMNVQDRLVALHHLDAPWRPSDLEQREGRIIRQGNKLYEADPENFEVRIMRYATKQTLDSRMWQTIEAKARFIEQVRKGAGSREIEDVAGEAANSAEMKAASSGNPLILEEMTLRQQIKKLENQQTAHNREQFQIRDRMRMLASLADKQDRDAATADKDAKKLPKEFAVTIGKQTFDKHGEAGEAILAAAEAMQKAGEDSRELGTYGGFTLSLDDVTRAGGTKDVVLTIQGDAEYQIEANPGSNATGLALRLQNTVKGLATDAEKLRAQAERNRADIPKLETQVGEWKQADELADAKARHMAVIDQLRPKKKEQPAAAEGGETPAMSRSGDSVESIFAGLEKRGKAREQAMQAMQEHPNADAIRFVEDNFWNILGELEDSGQVTIKC